MPIALTLFDSSIGEFSKYARVPGNSTVSLKLKVTIKITNEYKPYV